MESRDVLENDGGGEVLFFFDLLKKDAQDDGPRTEPSELLREDSGLGNTTSVLLKSINSEMFDWLRAWPFGASVGEIFALVIVPTVAVSRIGSACSDPGVMFSVARLALRHLEAGPLVLDS